MTNYQLIREVRRKQKAVKQAEMALKKVMDDLKERRKVLIQQFVELGKKAGVDIRNLGNSTIGMVPYHRGGPNIWLPYYNREGTLAKAACFVIASRDEREWHYEYLSPCTPVEEVFKMAIDLYTVNAFGEE